MTGLSRTRFFTLAFSHHGGCLFVAGLSASEDNTRSSKVLIVVVGLNLRSCVGWLIYSGLGKLKPHRLFQITNILLLMLAGNLTSQWVKAMNHSNFLSSFAEPVWNIASWLPNDSLIGVLLHGIVGYDANPSQMHVGAYVLAVLIIGSASQMVSASALRSVLDGSGTSINQARVGCRDNQDCTCARPGMAAVSYTHLTLPTN